MDPNNIETLKAQKDLMSLKNRIAFKSAILVNTKKIYF